MNYLVLQHHHQNIKVRNHNLTLKQILAFVGVNVPIHIPDVPDISSLTKIYTTSTSNVTHRPTYEHFHSHFIPEKEGKKKIFHTRNI